TCADQDWKVLVVDGNSVRVVSTACRLSEMTEEGISLIENVELDRQPMPNMHAIYFLTPSWSSVKRLCSDFQEGKPPKYAAAHVYFTSQPTDETLFPIKQCKLLLDRLKTFKVLNTEYLAMESQVFSLDLPQAFHVMFGKAKQEERSSMQMMIANRLATLCVSLGVRPIVRYRATTPPHSDVSEVIARALELQLDRLEKQAESSNIGLWFNSATEKTTVDAETELEEGLTHNDAAMAQDLLEIQGDKYKYSFSGAGGQQVEKEVLLNDTDPLWPRIKHMHIADTIEFVLNEFNRFASENKARSEAPLLLLVTCWPQAVGMELVGKYSLHMDVVRKCMSKFNDLKLEDIATWEQNMSCHQDAEGKAVKRNSVTTGLSTLLVDKTIEISDKLRLILIYFLTMERNPQQQDNQGETLIDQLLGMAEAQHYAHLIANLDSLIQISTPASSRSSMSGLLLSLLSLLTVECRRKFLKWGSKEKTGDVSYNISRYRPPLQELLELLTDSKLPIQSFPTVNPEDADAVSTGQDRPKNTSSELDAITLGMSTRSRPRTCKVSNAGEEKEEEGKQQAIRSPLIVFVVGGVTYSEMRAAYHVSQVVELDLTAKFCGPLKLLVEPRQDDPDRRDRHAHPKEVRGCDTE
ncbi:Sec1 family protein B, partial [Guillardia theta CCMP2712]